MRLCTYKVDLVDGLHVLFVDELDDSYWCGGLTRSFTVPRMSKDRYDYDLVHPLYGARDVVDAGQEVLHQTHVVAVDDLACLEGLPSQSKGVGVEMATAPPVLPLHVLQLLCLCELFVVLLPCFSDPQNLSVFFLLVLFNREQVVVVPVSEEDSNPFKAEEVGQDLPRMHDEVSVGALCADDT